MHIVHTESSRVIGGQERRVLAESVGMRERGHRVSLVTPADGVLAHRASDAGLEVIPAAFHRGMLPRTVFQLRSLFGRLAPDIVNSHSSADSWPVALTFASGPRHGALVRSRHISAAVGPGALHRFLYAQADHVITTGERIRADLAEGGIVPADRSTSIPTAVDCSRYRPSAEVRARTRTALGLAADTPVVGVVAFLRPDKGHAVLIEAMPAIRARHPGVVLELVGDGSERSALEAQVARLGLEGCVRFHGRREDVPDFLPALDVFCLPSVRNEGVPQVLAQAAASGLPVVSTRVGGIPEVVRDGETGFLVPAGDPATLAGAVGSLLSAPALRARMGAAGRSHVETVFSMDRMLTRTEEAYAAALAHASRRRGVG